ncbi:UTP--glucose-1-phosphate uridylyltransferase [Candidatus Entotheonellaceae bacterium PAL068K]
MRAMILAAGLGMRLRPLTDGCPKPLLPLMLQPMLAHLLEQLRRQDIREVAINLHYRAAQVAQWLGDGSRWGLRLHLSYEPKILGTAGGIKGVETFLGQFPVLVINADVLVDLDFRALWHWHCQREALVTMVVRPDPAARQYGAVGLDEANRVLGINGRPPAEGHRIVQETMFTGIQVVSPAALAHIPEGRSSSTTAEVYPALIAMHKAVYGYRYTGYWMDIGVPERYLQAHRDMLDGVHRSQWLDRLPEGSSAILDQQAIASRATQARLIPPVVLGPGVELAHGACVGPYAVLGAGCRVEAGAVVRDSVVGEQGHVAVGAQLHRCILGVAVCVPAVSVWCNRVRMA